MRIDMKLSAALLPAAVFAAVSWSCAPNPDPPHDKGMSFPLVGLHEALPCESCHGTDGFEALPTECAACHEQDRPPDHYPGDCGDCHDEFGWLGGNTTGDNPHQTTFPLQGPHDLQCSTCHVNSPVMSGLDPACESCHEDDRPPYHYAGGCAECHPVTNWAAGRQHPIILPHHNAPCEQCHVDAFDWVAFSCTTGCHAQPATDALHDIVYGYVYDSPQCWSCHPLDY